MLNTIKIETADENTLDYLQRKKDRNKLCYSFDPLEMSPLETGGKHWLIKGIIARGETSAWIAPPGAMKSALMAQLAMCVANFKDWNGLRHKNYGAVLYFALERHDLVKRRLWAHHTTMAMEDGCGVAVASGMVDLSTVAGVDRVVATVDAATQEIGNIGLVIIDTFAKLVSAAGLDENKASDQGRIFANLQRVKDKLNRGKIGSPHIAIVGHTGKDETRGARGSNAFYGDVDVMVEISTNGDLRTASVTKANDMAEGPIFSFTSEVHTFGTDEDGDLISVNIVSSEPVAISTPKANRAGRWPKGLKLVHEAITGALLEKGADHRVNGDGPTVKAVNVMVARSIHAQRFVSAGEGDRDAAERQAWRRNFAKARQSDLIGAETANGLELVWLIAA